MSADYTMEYTFNLKGTEGTVGYVACEPPEDLSFEDALAYLESHPLDEFMHKHLLVQIKEVDQKKFKDLLNQAICEGTLARPVLAALLYEACLLHGKFSKQMVHFPAGISNELKQHTPLVYIKWSELEDKEAHLEWSELFRSNIFDHHMLPLPDDTDLPMLYEDAKIEDVTSVAQIREEMLKEPYGKPWVRPPAQETAMLALERLVEYGFVAEVEMRHMASLSPIALLRRWNIDLSVRCGRHNYTLQGLATSYGRGLSLADTRAGYSMEMVERGSSFASFAPDKVLDTYKNYPITIAKYSELTAQGINALDPNAIPLEVPYEDEPLHWMEGSTPADDRSGMEPILVPIQFVYMFCNLDEINLFSSPGSTGLASGNILEEAKVAALTEIIERDAEATKPYHKSQCFTLASSDEKVNMLLEDYKARGVNIMFQDCTTEFGIPCYTAFVIGRKGEITRGTGAGLNGQRAAISALTETPYPYPQSPPSAPLLKDLPVKALEELPDMSLEDPIRNLELLERTLIANNRKPVYVELKREDLLFPVVKALIPGLELTADFDSYSRMSKRLFANYLALKD